MWHNMAPTGTGRKIFERNFPRHHLPSICPGYEKRSLLWSGNAQDGMAWNWWAYENTYSISPMSVFVTWLQRSMRTDMWYFTSTYFIGTLTVNCGPMELWETSLYWRGTPRAMLFLKQWRVFQIYCNRRVLNKVCKSSVLKLI